MLVIYKKELKSYFNGMMGYVFIAFALAVIGVYTVAVSFLQSYPNFEYVLDSVRFLFVLIIPVLTMRTMADNMAWMLKKIHSGDNPAYPEREPWQPMGFIR